ncbi:MAG: hypothetical protein R3F59_12150 [Myxococcota bacterium]
MRATACCIARFDAVAGRFGTTRSKRSSLATIVSSAPGCPRIARWTARLPNTAPTGTGAGTSSSGSAGAGVELRTWGEGRRGPWS